MHTEVRDIRYQFITRIFDDDVECEMYTKTVDLRKRKKYALNINSRKQKKVEDRKKIMWYNQDVTEKRVEENVF